MHTTSDTKTAIPAPHNTSPMPFPIKNAEATSAAAPSMNKAICNALMVCSPTSFAKVSAIRHAGPEKSTATKLVQHGLIATDRANNRAGDLAVGQTNQAWAEKKPPRSGWARVPGPAATRRRTPAPGCANGLDQRNALPKISAYQNAGLRLPKGGPLPSPLTPTAVTGPVKKGLFFRPKRAPP
jgi:hypothetical protein